MPPETRPIDRQHHRNVPALMAFALVVIVPLVLFLPATSYDFVDFDDPGYVTDNPVVQQGVTGFGLLWSLVTFQHSNWHPVTWWSHMVDWQLFGAEPSGHHLSSVWLHAASAAVLLAALWRLSGSLWRSTFATLLFAVHPLKVESVVWISERKDLLSGLALMTALLIYADHGRTRRGRAAIAAAMGLGVAAKPILVVLPLLLVLLDTWPWPGRLPRLSLREALVSKWPLFAIALIGGLLTVTAQSRGGAVASLNAVPFSARFANAIVAISAYLGDIFWPQHLRALYAMRVPTLAQILGGLMIAALISIVAWQCRRRAPYLGFGWIWFLICLAPVIGILQVGAQARADRYTYLPSIGVAVAVAWAIGDFAGRSWRTRILGATFAALLVGALAVATRGQMPHWATSERLHQRSATLEPDNALEWTRLAAAQSAVGNDADAELTLRHAIVTAPNLAHAHSLLARVLLRLDRPDEALDAAANAVRLGPNSARIRQTAAQVLWSRGETEAAIFHLLSAISAEPAAQESYRTLALMLEADLEASDLLGLLDGYMSRQGPTPALELLRDALAGTVEGDPHAGAEKPTEAIGLFTGLEARAGIEMVRRAAAGTLASAPDPRDF